jgi:hypothetical protein
MNWRQKEWCNESMNKRFVLWRNKKINKPLAKLTTRKKTQLNKIRDDKGDLTTDTNEIQKLM